MQNKHFSFSLPFLCLFALMIRPFCALWVVICLGIVLFAFIGPVAAVYYIIPLIPILTKSNQINFLVKFITISNSSNIQSITWAFLNFLIPVNGLIILFRFFEGLGHNEYNKTILPSLRWPSKKKFLKAIILCHHPSI